METENSNQTPAAATEEAVATKNGGNATQEVSSTSKQQKNKVIKLKKNIRNACRN